MRDLFRGYYRPTKQQFETLWNEAIFSFDANLLLHIYRYSAKLRERYFQILDEIGPRIWVTYQAAYEFQKNRLAVISEQANAYQTILETLERAANTIRSIPRRHPTLDVDRITKDFVNLAEKHKKKLAEAKTAHPDVLPDDTLRERLTALLTGKVGHPFDSKRKEEIAKQGEERFRLQIPPGFRDVGKKEDSFHKYGDLALWLELIDHAIQGKKPLILVTDDSSDDWWWEFGEKTIGPRPELVQEFFLKTGQDCYLYRSDQFIEHATKYFQLEEQLELVKEATEIRARALVQATGTIITSGVTHPFQHALNYLTREVQEAYPDVQLSHRSDGLTVATVSPSKTIAICAFESPTASGEDGTVARLVAASVNSEPRHSYYMIGIVIPPTSTYSFADWVPSGLGSYGVYFFVRKGQRVDGPVTSTEIGSWRELNS